MDRRLHRHETMLPFVAVVLALLPVQSASQGSQAASPQIIFVCEHGAAKSVIAAAYFNKLAKERGLPFRATFRGTAPQEALSSATVAGLRADGVPVPDQRPTSLDRTDIDRATYIFAIGCPLPEAARVSGKADAWSDVPDVSDGYAAARNAIVRHVEELLSRLQR